MQRGRRRYWRHPPYHMGFTLALVWLLLVCIILSVLRWRDAVATRALIRRRTNPREASTPASAPRVAEPNVSVDALESRSGTRRDAELLRRLLELGYKREQQFDLDRRDAWRWSKGSCPPVAAAAAVAEEAAKRQYAPIAYVTCVSNEEFIDGALVLGVSLRKVSAFLQAGVADLSIIVTCNRISDASKKRLLAEGTYNHVFEAPSLAHRAPGRTALFRDTFDKIHIFNLTMYEKVVFMDADMIAVRSMDKLFSAPMLRSPDYVGAIGGKGYFQTGMMVIIPTYEMFSCIYDTLIRGTPPTGSKFVGSGARDGVLLRSVFEERFRSISKRHSRNLNPRFHINSEGPGKPPIIAVHLRGMFKPWFDKTKPNLMVDLGRKEYGFTYLQWWTLYEEEVHKKSAYYRKALQMQRDGPALGAQSVVVDGIAFGGTHSVEDGVNISPLTHVWMQRHSKDSYVQLLSSEDRRRRNRTLPSLRKVASPRFGLSCDRVCTQMGLQCSAEALYFSSLNDCEELRSVFGCAKCEIGVYWGPHPGSDFPALEVQVQDEDSTTMVVDEDKKTELICRYNYLHDTRGLPTCSASHPLTRRYCPCVGAA